MPDVTKRFRWGASVLAILHHFSTPEVRVIKKTCKKLIEDFTNPELEGEGYRCAIIPVEICEYGFVLAYNFEAEEWVLEVFTFPDWDSPESKRKRPSDPDGGDKRVAETNMNGRRRRDWAWLTDKLEELYKTHATSGFGPMLTAFRRDTCSMRGLQTFAALLRGNRIPQQAREHVASVIQNFRLLAEQQSQGCKDVVQLVRGKVNEALWFLRPLSSFQMPRLQHVNCDVLWDATLFGALPE